MVLITKRWRRKTPFWTLVLIEFPVCIAALTLYAIAQPDLYKTKLQLEGYLHGWNSDPALKLYAASNHVKWSQPLPWSKFVTNYNVVISIISLFILLTKVTLFILHCFLPVLSVLVHLMLIGLYTYSIYAQASPDKADPSALQNGAPWPIARGCGSVVDGTLRGYCRQFQACFAVTILILVIYLVYLGLSIQSVIPTPEQKEKYQEKQAKKAEFRAMRRDMMRMADEEDPSELSKAMQWQLHNLPTPGLPPPTAGGSLVTPRTNAFNMLNGSVSAPRPVRVRPETTVVIPSLARAVTPTGTEKPAGHVAIDATPLSWSPGTSSAGSPYKSDLPFRNLGSATEKPDDA